MLPIRLAIGAAVVAGSILTFGARADAHVPTVNADCHRLRIEATDYPQGSHVKAVVDGQTPLDIFFAPSFVQYIAWSTTMTHHWAVTITSPDGIGNLDQHGDAGPCETLTVATVPNPTTTTLPWVDCHASPPATADVAEHCPPPPTEPLPGPPTTACPDGQHWNSAIGTPGWCSDNLTPIVGAVTGGEETAPTTVPCQEDEPCFDCATMGNHVCEPATVAQRAATPAKLPATGGEAVPLLAIAAGVLTGGTILLLARRPRRRP